MITVLIAAGAGVGGILIGAGWVIWRVSRRYTLRARPVEPVRLPAGAQVGDVLVSSQRLFPGDPGKPTLMAPVSWDASADYDPRHAADPWGYMRPMVDAISAMREKGPVRLMVHEERYRAEHAADTLPRVDSFDVAPAIPYPYPVSAEHPPTDIDD